MNLFTNAKDKKLEYHMKPQLHSLFKDYFQINCGDFIDTMSTLFAYTVLTESENGLAQEPLDIDKFFRLEQILESSHMLNFDIDLDNSNDAKGVADLEDSTGVITWKQQFIYNIQEYVKDSFHTMIIESNPSMLQKYLSKEDLKDEEKVFLIVKKLETLAGEEFFNYCVEDCQVILFGANPRALYDRGEAKAREILQESEDYSVNSEEDLKELADVLVQSNILWSVIQKLYFSTYNEYLPMTLITLDLYETKLKEVLQQLQDHDVPVEHIAELTHWIRKFDKETTVKILEFEYI
jgi:hypothetical protein